MTFDDYSMTRYSQRFHGFRVKRVVRVACVLALGSRDTRRFKEIGRENEEVSHELSETKMEKVEPRSGAKTPLATFV